MKNKTCFFMILCFCLLGLAACSQASGGQTAAPLTETTALQETSLPTETQALPTVTFVPETTPAPATAPATELVSLTTTATVPSTAPAPVTAPEPTTVSEPATTIPEPATAAQEPATTVPDPISTVPEPIATVPEPTTQTPETTALPAIPSGSKSDRENTEGEDSFNEGENTPCWVETYQACQGALSSYFLKPGDRIAVIAPSTLPSWGAVNAVVQGLKAWGYVPVEGQYLYKHPRTLADCRADMVWALTDASIRGIFCVRGGYGASEVMDGIPMDMIRNAAKPIIGYSDISVFHAAWTKAGLPSIHAGMNRTFLDEPGAPWVLAQQQMMQGQLPVYVWEGSPYNQPGSAEGVLIGGNLSTLTTVLQTAYDCTSLGEPYILFLEDVEEDMEHIHRFLTILKHAGVLDKAAGIIFGEWIEVPSESEITDGSSRGGAFNSVADMIRRSFFPESDIPLAFGFPSGHGTVNYPLLMGTKANLAISGQSARLAWGE